MKFTSALVGRSYLWLLFVACLLSDGRESYAQFQISSPVPSSVGITIAAAVISDVTGDGIVDLCSIDAGGQIVIATGFGDGVHGEIQSFDYGAGIDGLVRAIAAADLDADGDEDLVFTWSHPLGVGGFLSIVPFELGIPGSRIDFSLDQQVNRTPFDIAVGDLNQDGRLDLIAGTNILDQAFQPAYVSVLMGDAAAIPGVMSFETPVHYFRSSMVRDVHLEDLDADGDHDVIMTCRGGNSLSVFENVGAGILSFASESLFPLLPEPYAVKTTDLDGDGVMDILLGTWQTKSLIPLLGLGNLQYSRQNEIELGQLGWGVMHRFELEDMNGDGHLDAVAPFSSGVISIHYGDGQGNFEPGPFYVTYQSAKSLWFHDLDDNGTREMVLEHTDLKLFTTFFGAFELRGHVYFDSQRIPAGLESDLVLKGIANLGIRGIDTAIDIDRALLIPLDLVPSQAVMLATGGLGPDFWSVDLGVNPQDPVTLSAILQGNGQGGLGAGLINEVAILGVQTASLSNPIQTTIAPAPLSIGGPTLSLTGGISVSVNAGIGWLDIEVPIRFVRGDVNQNGDINVGDAVILLRRLFGLDSPGQCLAAEDTDGDGATDIGDAVRILTYLFSSGIPPVEPFPGCGLAADPLLIECESHSYCP